MGRDLTRRIDTIVNRGGGTSVSPFQSLGKTLLAKRDARKQQEVKAPPPKLTLTTAKEKQKVLEEMMTARLPSALSLLKLRKMAAQGKILDKHARDFLNRSAAGKKLESSESIQKYTEEALQAELEATAENPHSPVDYRLRHGGAEHLTTKAKTVIRELRKDAVQKVVPEKPSAMDIRRERLSILHGIQGAAAQPPATAPAQRPTTPVFQTPMPLTPSAGSFRSTSPIFAPNTGPGRTIGSPTTGPGSPGAVGVGLPVLQHDQPDQGPGQVPVDVGTPIEPQTQPSEPADQDSDSPLPPPPTVPPESGAVSDAFGGSGDDE